MVLLAQADFLTKFLRFIILGWRSSPAYSVELLDSPPPGLDEAIGISKTGILCAVINYFIANY